MVEGLGVARIGKVSLDIPFENRQFVEILVLDIDVLLAVDGLESPFQFGLMRLFLLIGTLA